MCERPSVDPADAGDFLRAAALHVTTTSRTEVRGHVDASEEHHTPWGVVHGGLYATTIESACSIGASAAGEDAGTFAVGLSNTTDFVRAHKQGRLDVHAWAIHQGRTGQLWQCDITREDGKLVAQGRVRLQNVPLPS